ncbi:hypothetical protein H4R21_001592 [Coemansia helicoidea]|uniref:Uncharacterized protein n=1 Tax=Coemansia helicoidea TaxID=1286919 RepID=A0ACC1LBA3_9FUNG|nr:hypothetical protein H4R21_001592 [Coemansia helicoidea]
MAANFLPRLKERLLRPGGPPLTFRITNIVVAILMIVSGIVFFTWKQFEHIMLGVFELLFGAWIIVFELAESPRLAQYVQFMYTWFGRGLLYVFIGCLTLGYKAFGWVFGAIIAGVGVVYIVLAFTLKRDESYAASIDSGRPAGESIYDPNAVYGPGMALPYILARRSLRFGRRASVALLVANVLLGALVFVQGCLSAAVGDVRHVMLGILCLVAGLTLVVSEFVHVGVLRVHAAFLFSFAGRGLFYAMLGCLTVDTKPAVLGIGVALAVAGTAMLALALAPRLSFDDPADQYASATRGALGGAASDGLPHVADAALQPPKSVLALGISAPLGASSSTYGMSQPRLAYPQSPERYATSAAGRAHRV